MVNSQAQPAASQQGLTELSRTCSVKQFFHLAGVLPAAQTSMLISLCWFPLGEVQLEVTAATLAITTVSSCSLHDLALLLKPIGTNKAVNVAGQALRTGY